jgi:hypothetical protein
MNPADMTREELIIEVSRVRTLIAGFIQIWDEMKRKQDDDYTFDPFIPEIPDIPVEIKPIRTKKYTCECGAEVTFKSRNRHEASSKHIRMMANITE